MIQVEVNRKAGADAGWRVGNCFTCFIELSWPFGRHPATYSFTLLWEPTLALHTQSNRLVCIFHVP